MFASISASIARRRSSRAGSVTPNTARRITSSVTACIRGWIGNGSPSGQESISVVAASAITDSYRRMRSPWKAGSISLRRERCSAPSRSSTERGPITGSSATVRPGGSPFSRLR